MVIVWDLDYSLFEPDFLGKLSREFKLRGMLIFHRFTTFKRPYFHSESPYSQMVGRAGSTTGTVHAHMSLTRSKVKVKVKGLLNFRKLAKLFSAVWRHFVDEIVTRSI